MQTVLQSQLLMLFTLVYKIVLLFLVVFIPYILAKVFFTNWLSASRAAFFSKQKYVLLELKTPKNISKSQLAMELFIASLHQTGGDGGFWQRHMKGSVRPWFSLEIASIDGVVRFFVWARANFRDMIETQLYSQFPDIEITDYTGNDYTEVPWNPEKFDYWGCEFIKGSASHLPIKTYTMYGLTGGGKEESKVDPITPMIEFLGSLKKGEQVWFQIGVRAHTKEITKPGTWFEKVDWKYAANQDLIKRTKRDLKMDKEKPVNPMLLQLTKAEKEAVEAIEDNLSKVAFDCNIRAIYIARKEVFRATTIPGLTGSFRQYGAPNLNSFKTVGTPGVKYSWQDLSGKVVLGQKRSLVEKYQHRAFFIPEYIPTGIGAKPFVMTTEELATIYHFPGEVSKTPTLSRVQAKKVEAPSNLPI